MGRRDDAKPGHPKFVPRAKCRSISVQSSRFPQKASGRRAVDFPIWNKEDVEEALEAETFKFKNSDKDYTECEGNNDLQSNKNGTKKLPQSFCKQESFAAQNPPSRFLWFRRKKCLNTSLVKGKKVRIPQLHLRNRFYCLRCHYTTVWRTEFYHHILTHNSKKRLKCQKCKYKTNKKTSFDIHMYKHSKVKMHRCSKCPFATVSKKLLRLHLLIHSPSKPLKCSRCNFNTTKKTFLRIHKLTHLHPKTLKCARENCKFKTKSKKVMENHKALHFDSEVYKCNFSKCKYSTKLKKSFCLHHLIHTIKVFKCKRVNCKYETSRKYCLKIHELSHSETKLYKCEKPNCKYQTNSNYNFGIHSLSHFRFDVFKCPKPGCRYETNYKNDLARHRLSHLQIKEFKCEKDGCGFFTYRQDSLRKHALIHFNPDDSTYAGLNFYVKKQRGGIFDVHKLLPYNVVLYKCIEANCHFETDEMMEAKVHQTIHSGRKLYQCPKCKFSTNYHRCLRRHKCDEQEKAVSDLVQQMQQATLANKN